MTQFTAVGICVKDPEFRAEYQRARAEIAQIDAIMTTLDHLREEAGFSKAHLARQIGKDPASIRRLFTAQVNPELKTIAALAQALDAEIQIVPRSKKVRRLGDDYKSKAPRSIAT